MALEAKVLDEGVVRLLDVMGDDTSIVAAARVSTGGGGSKGEKADRQLIHYLMKNMHTSPFEMVEFKFYVKMPIFVARQWVRHRTASLNEISGRYSELKTEFYLPEKSRLKGKGKINKQGSEGDVTEKAKELFINSCELQNHMTTQYYDTDNQNNIANELARINLPVSTYTEMIWKMDLKNLFHFLKLRTDYHAQYEIQVYAKAMAEMVKAKVPLAYEAFEEYILNSISLSQSEIKKLKDINHPEVNEIMKSYSKF